MFSPDGGAASPLRVAARVTADRPATPTPGQATASADDAELPTAQRRKTRNPATQAARYPGSQADAVAGEPVLAADSSDPVALAATQADAAANGALQLLHAMLDSQSTEAAASATTQASTELPTDTAVAPDVGRHPGVEAADYKRLAASLPSLTPRPISTAEKKLLCSCTYLSKPTGPTDLEF